MAASSSCGRIKVCMAIIMHEWMEKLGRAHGKDGQVWRIVQRSCRITVTRASHLRQTCMIACTACVTYSSTRGVFMTTTVKGYAALGLTSALQPFSFERRAPRADDVAISIKYCGVCHSDIHQARDEWGGSAFPMVPGHEIAGVVTAVGADVTKFKVGDHVGVGCFVDSCTTCKTRNVDLEQYMPGLIQTYNGLEADGKTATQGGYSDSIVVKEGYVLSIPANLPLDATAPLLCAGITLYSPLRHWQAGPGKKVAIVGLGGLGHMGVKLAHAFGAEVTVLSQSLKKQEDGKRMGADHYYATSDPGTFTALQASFDLVVNTVSADIDWNQYLGLVKLD